MPVCCYRRSPFRVLFSYLRKDGQCGPETDPRPLKNGWHAIGSTPENRLYRLCFLAGGDTADTVVLRF